jgi:hypothetical protein
MNALAATGSPIAPSSITLRQVCNPAPMKVSGAQPTRTPFAAANSTRRRPSSNSIVSGFSL